MSRRHRWESLQQHLLGQGVDMTSEEGRTVCYWLWSELDHQPPADWQAALPAVVAQALSIYRTFAEQFDAVFMGENGRGESWVRMYLRTRCGFAAPPVVEAVLNRIRNRRLHLLSSF